MTSEIRANIIKNRVGLGTIEYSNTGPVISGITTALNFKTGTSNLHSTGLNVQFLDVDGHTNLDNVRIVGVTTIIGTLLDLNSSSANPAIVKLQTNTNTCEIEARKVGGENNLVLSSNNSTDHLVITGNTVKLPNDDQRLEIGANQELKIAQDGTHNVTYMQNVGTLQLQTDDLKLFNYATTDLYFRAQTNAGVSLYYDYSNHSTAKLATTATGVTIDGTASVSGSVSSNGLSINAIAPTIYLYDSDANSDFSIQVNSGLFKIMDSTNSYATRLSINSSGNVSIAKDLDVDGHTNLDNVSIAGISTFAGNIVLGDSIVHDGDIDTKIVFTDNQIDFQTAGASRLQVSSHVKLPDNAQIQLGNAGTNDFVLVHDGTDNIINCGNNGILFYRSVTHKLQSILAEDMLVANSDGSVELYHNGLLKLSTVSTGIEISANEANNANIYMTADEGDDNGDQWILQSQASTNNFNFYNNTSGSPALKLSLKPDGDVGFYGDITVPGNILHSGDTDTKIAFTDNQIDLQCAGSSRAYINNYGFYIASGFPLAFLSSSGPTPHIKSGGTNSQNLLFTTGSGNPTRLSISSTGTVNIGPTSQSTHLLYLQSTGDAGIHIRADSGNSDENANPYVSFSQDGGNTQQFKIGMIGDAGNEFAQSIGNASFIHANNANSQPLQLAHMDNLALTISAVESSHFHSKSGISIGGLKIANRGNDTGAALLLQGHNNTGTPGQATNTQLTHDGGSLLFEIKHNGTERLRITPTGTTMFILNGVPTDDSTSNIILGRHNTGNEGGQMAFARANDNSAYWKFDCFGNGNGPRLRMHRGGYERFNFNDNGNFQATGTVTSDRDLKEDIQLVTGTSIDKVIQLTPKSFKYIGNDTFHTGFIAQEVKEVWPSLVNGTDGNKDMGVDYYGIVAHLCNCVKELKAENDSLKARVTTLEGS